MWEARRVAEYCCKGQGDLQHRSAMSWGGTGDRELASRLFEASLDVSSGRPRAVRLVGKLADRQAR